MLHLASVSSRAGKVCLVTPYWVLPVALTPLRTGEVSRHATVPVTTAIGTDKVHSVSIFAMHPHRRQPIGSKHKMLTGKLKNQVDEVWEAFWTGGIANPIQVIEQFTYLLFIRRLDEIHTKNLKAQTLLGDNMETVADLTGRIRQIEQRAVGGGRIALSVCLSPSAVLQ
jgi:hypothetical protein